MLNELYEESKKLGYLPRQIQIDAIKWIESVWNSENQCKVISAPVGSGKSLIAKTISQFLAKRGEISAIITPQNLLIDQYSSEFPDLNYFKGKAHYFCKTVNAGCDEGMEVEKTSKIKCENCPYAVAKERCYDECTTLFNPMSYFVLPKLEKVGDRYEVIYAVDTIIIDEVQSLPAMLRELTTIKVWSHDIQWESGITASIPKIIELLSSYANKLGFYIRNQNLLTKEKIKLISLQRRIDYIAYQLTKDSSYFICEENIEKYKGIMTACLLIRPKYVPPSIYKNFFKNAKRVILMSGTTFSYIWEELGFKDIDYIDLPSPIPKERRMVFSTNSIDINFKIKEPLKRWDLMQQLCSQINYIVDELHPKENGVILLPYNLADELKSLLTDDHYWHMDKKTKKEKIDEFRLNKSYKVGVFSGSYEGISLNDNISRFTIIPKVMYANLGDKVVKIRMAENELNYALETMAMIIQSSGRSTRSEKDYSAIYILDKNFGRLYTRTKKYLPKYFKESLKFSLPDLKDIAQLNQFRMQAKI